MEVHLTGMSHRNEGKDLELGFGFSLFWEVYSLLDYVVEGLE